MNQTQVIFFTELDNAGFIWMKFRRQSGFVTHTCLFAYRDFKLFSFALNIYFNTKTGGGVNKVSPKAETVYFHPLKPQKCYPRTDDFKIIYNILNP